MEPLPILTEPDPRLRQIARLVTVEEILVPDFQIYLDQLLLTMQMANGIGIASTQVGKNMRAIVVHMPDQDTCLMNPEILKASESIGDSEEGCLSVPGQYGIVSRYKRVRVSALTRHGRHIEFDARGLVAIILQHEIDHLNGILFIDKATSISRTGSRHI